MDSKKTKKIGFLLTPKIQDRLIAVMTMLESEGVKPTNKVMIEVLQLLARDGEILKLNDNDIAQTVKKIVPEGGKILHIRKDIPDQEQNEEKGG